MKNPVPKLTTAQLDLLPTAIDVDFYEKHGWYISPQILSDEIIDQAIAGSERFYRGDRDSQLPVQHGYSNGQPVTDETIRNSEFVSLQNKELGQLVRQPIISAIAARLARTSQIRLLDDQLVYKIPQNHHTAIGWHTDRAYWSTCTSDQLLTAWIPFHDCPAAQGPLVVMDGSHHWSGLEHLRHFNQQDLDHLENQLCPAGRSITKVPMTLKKGQVSFHHCRSIHGSYPNLSSQPRIALAIHFQDRDNQYQPYWNDAGQEIHIFNEQLCQKLPNGHPDFSDPNIFPVLWQEQAA
jgi:ectoine hydroxylase-related dioxygenase (phytanoyl-CoA dioxygenase family)